MGLLPPELFLPTLAIVTYAVPAGAAAVTRRRRPLSVPLMLIAVYCAATFVESCIQLYLSRQDVHNLWMVHLYTPFEATLLLWAFSRWQLREVSRMTVLLSIPLFLVTWATLLFTAESLGDFPQYAKSVECILIVSVAAYTLVTRSQSLVAPVTRYPWFWASVGVLLYFSFLTVLNPISNALLPHSRDLVIAAFQMNAFLLVVCNILFAWAMLCPHPHPSSGGSSLPQLSLR